MVPLKEPTVLLRLLMLLCAETGDGRCGTGGPWGAVSGLVIIRFDREGGCDVGAVEASAVEASAMEPSVDDDWPAPAGLPSEPQLLEDASG